MLFGAWLQIRTDPEMLGRPVSPLGMKVLTYNIQEGGCDRLSAIESVISRESADAVSLIEASSMQNAEALARAFDMQLTVGPANNGYHVDWLSRLLVRRARNHNPPQLAKTLLEIEVEWSGTVVGLFATHLATSRWDGHGAVDEIPAILDVLRRRADRPHLLVGDFNALHPADTSGTPPVGVEKREGARDGDPRPEIQTILDAGYVDCYRMLHPQSPGYTYPAHHPWLRLDYIFASPSMATVLESCGVTSDGAAAVASDHLPVWATFRPPTRE